MFFEHKFTVSKFGKDNSGAFTWRKYHCVPFLSALFTRKSCVKNF